jgi:hypothetical protein
MNDIIIELQNFGMVYDYADDIAILSKNIR